MHLLWKGGPLSESVTSLSSALVANWFLGAVKAQPVEMQAQTQRGLPSVDTQSMRDCAVERKIDSIRNNEIWKSMRLMWYGLNFQVKRYREDECNCDPPSFVVCFEGTWMTNISAVCQINQYSKTPLTCSLKHSGSKPIIGYRISDERFQQAGRSEIIFCLNDLHKGRGFC